MKHIISTFCLIINLFISGFLTNTEAKKYIPKTRTEKLEHSLRPFVFTAIDTGLVLNTKTKKDLKQ